MGLMGLMDVNAVIAGSAIWQAGNHVAQPRTVNCEANCEPLPLQPSSDLAVKVGFNLAAGEAVDDFI
jgi:hypothetical protein